MSSVNKHYPVLDIPIYNGTIDSFVDTVINTEENENNRVSASGAHGIIETRYDASFYKILNEFEFNLPDGKPGVWVARSKGATEIQRCFGPFVFRDLMIASAKTDIKHYFAGGREGVAEQLKEACAKKFDNHNIVGTHCPPFREIEEHEFEALGKEINDLGADIVWVGISTPKQEKYAYRLSKYTKVKYLITVGAAFDYHTDSIVPAPAWMQEAGLEWAFRLYLEPKRLWKRYINIVPKFLIFGIMDIFGVYKHPQRMK
jgi:N-acetylglucosaminyldiphosphoundecaprenol N-acetyl-beta-D-mannosaminyltransferase